MAQQQQHAPSAERRKRLKEREAREGKKLMKVSDSFPIEKYYGMSERLLQAFHQAVDERRLDDAYVFGLRFATFGIESLPKHSQYNHPHFKRLKGKNARHVDEVLKKLESVAARMDAEELRLARQRKEAALAKQREAEARQQQAKQQEQERLQREATKTQRHQDILQKQREELRAQQKQQAQQELEQRAMDKLKLLNQQTNQAAPAQQPKQQRQPANTTLISANTGQAPTTMEAIAKERAQDAARLKEEQEKREASASEAAAQATAPEKKVAKKKKTKRTSKTKAPEATKAAPPPPPKTVKQPSKLDPNAQAQVNQLKEEIAKQQQEEAKSAAPTTTVDYKSEFAKHQAEWKSKQEKPQSKKSTDAKKKKKKKQDAPSSDSGSSTDSKKKKKKQDAPGSTSCNSVPPPPATAKKRLSGTNKQTSKAKIQQLAAVDPPPTSATPAPQKPVPAKQTSQTNIQQQQQQHQVKPQEPAPPPKNEGYSGPQPVQPPPPAMVVSAGRKESSPKRSSMMAGAKAGAKSTLKLLTSLSPKRNKQIGPNNEAPPQEEGFELKLTDAGPAVVDDFSYHDKAYRAKLTPSEAKTIQMLEKAIHLQENRLQVLESSPERQTLRAEAKRRLKGGDRKGALYCLARKKRINQTIEVVKQAIFNMETQIIMLESAVENREVNKIMKEASDAMASHGNGVRVNDFTDERLGDVLASVGQGDMEYDEEELLSELHDGEQPVGNVDDVDDIDGLLSLPSAPEEPCPIPDVLPKKESDAVSKIIASLF